MSADPGGAATPTHLWSLREDALVEFGPEPGRLVIVTTWREMVIDNASDTVVELLRRMCLGPISLENVTVGARAGDAAGLRRMLTALSGSVVRSLGLCDGDRPLLSAVPIARKAALLLPEIGHDRPLRLSRFAAIRSQDNELLVESPLANYHVILHRPLAAHVLTALCATTTVRRIAGQVGAEPVVVAEIVSYLVGVGIVLVDDSASNPVASNQEVPEFAEDHDPALMRWSHHDLLFHACSRMGRYGGQSGAIFPFAERLPSPELVKTVHAGTQVALPGPDIDELIRTDAPLTEVLEISATRCASLTDHELSTAQVGELLFRSARIRSVGSGSAGNDVRYEISDRPYLSMAGLYELELYVCANKCGDLPRGIYHYDPRRHLLTLINDSESELAELLEGARVAARTPVDPPLMITMTARAARTSWMYGGIGYSLALNHGGALQQTLCLVANAMGLAACVPAIDLDDITTTALRLDWPAEVGVGELLIG